MRFFWTLVLAMLLSAPLPAQRMREGVRAPAFAIDMTDGATVTRDDVRGQVVVINLWATWCLPCRLELPHIDLFYREHRGNGLRVFAVGTEEAPNPRFVRATFADAVLPVGRGITLPYRAIDGNLPTTYVIDRAGVLRYARSGAIDYAFLERFVEPLLKEPAPE